MRRYLRRLILSILVIVSVGTSGTLQAQEATAPPAGTPEQNANAVRIEFLRVLRSQPATVREVLRIDPSLMQNDQYMAPYPALAAYISQHPEIPRNPGYFVGTSFSSTGDDILTGVFVFTIMLTVAGVLIWLIRTLIDYRRWSRLSRAQTEVHSKLLDRFTNIDDLQKYFASPAARGFLESAPIRMDVGTPSAPANRILWSLQVGLVLALAGIGFHVAIPNLSEPDAVDALRVIGTLAIALGLGFILSAGASLVLSRRLGLFGPTDGSPARRD